MGDRIYIEDDQAIAGIDGGSGYAYEGTPERDVVDVDIDVHSSQYRTLSINTGGGADQVATTGGHVQVDTAGGDDVVIIDSDAESPAIRAHVDTGAGDDIIFVGRQGFGPVYVDVQPGSGTNTVQFPENEDLDEQLSVKLSISPDDCEPGSVNVVRGMDVLPAGTEEYESFADSIDFGRGYFASLIDATPVEVQKGIPEQGSLVLNFNEKGSEHTCRVVLPDVKAEDVGDLVVKSYGEDTSVSVQLTAGR